MFVFPYIGGGGNNITKEDSYQKCFLARLKIENYNIEIDGRNFYDQSVMTQLNNMMKSENINRTK